MRMPCACKDSRVWPGSRAQIAENGVALKLGKIEFQNVVFEQAEKAFARRHGALPGLPKAER